MTNTVYIYINMYMYTYYISILYVMKCMCICMFAIVKLNCKGDQQGNLLKLKLKGSLQSMGNPSQCLHCYAKIGRCVGFLFSILIHNYGHSKHPNPWKHIKEILLEVGGSSKEHVVMKNWVGFQHDINPLPLGNKQHNFPLVGYWIRHLSLVCGPFVAMLNGKIAFLPAKQRSLLVETILRLATISWPWLKKNQDVEEDTYDEDLKKNQGSWSVSKISHPNLPVIPLRSARSLITMMSPLHQAWLEGGLSISQWYLLVLKRG